MTTLRKVSSEDLQQVFLLVCELESSGGETMELAAFMPVYLQNCKDENVYYLLAMHDDKAVGFGSMHVQRLLHHCGPVAEVQELIVTQEFQGRGVGKQLLRALEEEARIRGCRQIELCCNRTRIESNEFYSRQGYSKTHYKHVKKFQL
jgi:PhnO protein